MFPDVLIHSVSYSISYGHYISINTASRFDVKHYAPNLRYFKKIPALPHVKTVASNSYALKRQFSQNNKVILMSILIDKAIIIAIIECQLLWLVWSEIIGTTD